MDTNAAVITQLRAARGWTAYRLAAEAGLPRATVYLVERRGTASLEVLVKLAIALDAPLASFAPAAAELIERVRVR